MIDLAIRGARVAVAGPDGTRIERTDLGIDGERIVELGPVGPARRDLDADGLLVLPAVVDAHVHFNEPGRTEWEGLATGSAALAVGGGAVFVDMPLNSDPPVLDADAVERKRAAAEAASRCDFALWGGLTPDNVDRLPELAAAGVAGVKAFLCDSGIDAFRACDDATLWRGMQLAAEHDLVVAVHAENDALIRDATEAASVLAAGGGIGAAEAFARGRPAVAEHEAVARTLVLAEESGCRVHLVHLSSPRSVELVEAARARGVDASCETCPHYLSFTTADLDRLGPALKCAPPVRGDADREGLWRLLHDGRIDTVGSDHSPAPPERKEVAFADAWGGVAGVQSSLAVLLDGAAAGRIGLERIADVAAAVPARRLRLERKGAIAVGNDADLAIVDPSERWTLDASDLAQRWPISPYVGRSFTGRVLRTLRRGETLAVDGAAVADVGRGRMLRPVRP